MSGKFACAGAPFDVKAALQAFYGTLASFKLIEALGKPPSSHKRAAVEVTPGGAVKFGLVDDTQAQVLVPLVDEAWAEMNGRLVRDVVDLVLL